MLRTASGCAFAAIIALVSLTVAAPLKEPRREEDRDRDLIVGQWEIVESVYNGDKAGSKAVWAITKSHIVHGNETSPYELILTAKPKEIDLTIIRGEVRHMMLGIYELNGDSLRICFAYKGRPTDFDSGAGRNVFKFRRLKSK